MRHIVVIGLMGSGKSTVAAAVAGALGWPHHDSDADIRTATGRTARQIAAAEGIDHLHALELEHLLDHLARPDASVLSVAASLIDEPVGRAALTDPAVMVVWLRTAVATLERRTAAAAAAVVDDHRPRPEPVSVQAARRDPRFAEAADVIVDTDLPDGRDRPIDAVVADVLRGIRAASTESAPPGRPALG